MAVIKLLRETDRIDIELCNDEATGETWLYIGGNNQLGSKYQVNSIEDIKEVLGQYLLDNASSIGLEVVGYEEN